MQWLILRFHFVVEFKLSQDRWELKHYLVVLVCVHRFKSFTKAFATKIIELVKLVSRILVPIFI